MICFNATNGLDCYWTVFSHDIFESFDGIPVLQYTTLTTISEHSHHFDISSIFLIWYFHIKHPSDLLLQLHNFQLICPTSWATQLVCCGCWNKRMLLLVVRVQPLLILLLLPILLLQLMLPLLLLLPLLLPHCWCCPIVAVAPAAATRPLAGDSRRFTLCQADNLSNCPRTRRRVDDFCHFIWTGFRCYNSIQTQVYNPINRRRASGSLSLHLIKAMNQAN